VRSGTRIGVADTLTLRLAGAVPTKTDEDVDTTLRKPVTPRTP
jgi:hypothetical protein